MIVVVGVTILRRYDDGDYDDGDYGVTSVTMMIMRCLKMEIERVKMIMVILCYYMIVL